LKDKNLYEIYIINEVWDTQFELYMFLNLIKSNVEKLYEIDIINEIWDSDFELYMFLHEI